MISPYNKVIHDWKLVAVVWFICACWWYRAVLLMVLVVMDCMDGTGIQSIQSIPPATTY